MSTLDVHVLTLPGLPDEWVAQRRESIAEAVAQAGYPVYVHEVEGVDGHLGESRHRGYAAGVQPYVTHVDDDDWVREDAFSCLLPHMKAGVEVITTGEVQVYPDGREVPLKDSTHHLAVFQRSWLTQHGYSRFRVYPDQYLMNQPAESAHVPECVYYYRVREDSPCNRQRQQAGVAVAERRLISGLRRNKERGRAA